MLSLHLLCGIPDKRGIRQTLSVMLVSILVILVQYMAIRVIQQIQMNH